MELNFKHKIMSNWWDGVEIGLDAPYYDIFNTDKHSSRVKLKLGKVPGFFPHLPPDRHLFVDFVKNGPWETLNDGYKPLSRF